MFQNLKITKKGNQIMKTYDTMWICDIVCNMSVALKSENSELSDNEKKRVAMAITVLDPVVGKEFEHLLK